jgi:hypothetical protein
MANQSTPIGPANQWALAATAILNVSTRPAPRFDCLGGAPPSAEEAANAKTLLANSWGIPSREKLEAMIEWLATSGHSAEYQKAAAAFPQTPPPQQQADPRLAFIGQHGAEVGPRGLLAWDLGRLLSIAGWGFLAGYCNEIEAWGVMLPAADRLRNAYTSWEEYGQHYKLGAMFATPEAAAQVDQALSQLRAAPDSPWRTVPWALGGNANVSASPYGVPGAPGASPPGVAPTLAVGAVPPPGGAPYAGAPAGPAPYGGAPMPPVGAPYGGAPMAPVGAPYGGAPMAPVGAPYGGAPMAPTGGGKSKTGLIIGIAAGGLVVVGLLVGVVWHFTHEHESPHNVPAAPGGKPHPHH